MIHEVAGGNPTEQNLEQIKLQVWTGKESHSGIAGSGVRLVLVALNVLRKCSEEGAGNVVEGRSSGVVSLTEHICTQRLGGEVPLLSLKPLRSSNPYSSARTKLFEDVAGDPVLSTDLVGTVLAALRVALGMRVTGPCVAQERRGWRHEPLTVPAWPVTEPEAAVGAAWALSVSRRSDESFDRRESCSPPGLAQGANILTWAGNHHRTVRGPDEDAMGFRCCP